MNNLLQSLLKNYNNLLKERALIEVNLLKIKELIEINEKALNGDREDAPIPEMANKMPDIAAKTPDKPVNEPLKVTNDKPDNLPGYDEKMGWDKKVVYILSQTYKPATAKEIAAEIRKLEPNSRMSVEKSVELTTSRLSKAGIINARKEGVKNYYSAKREDERQSAQYVIPL